MIIGEDIMNNLFNREAKISAGISSQFTAIVFRMGQMKANQYIFVCIFCIQTFFIHPTTCGNDGKVLWSFHNDQVE